jgi:hypothetical protein
LLLSEISYLTFDKGVEVLIYFLQLFCEGQFDYVGIYNGCLCCYLRGYLIRADIWSCWAPTAALKSCFGLAVLVTAVAIEEVAIITLDGLSLDLNSITTDICADLLVLIILKSSDFIALQAFTEYQFSLILAR